MEIDDGSFEGKGERFASLPPTPTRLLAIWLFRSRSHAYPQGRAGQCGERIASLPPTPTLRLENFHPDLVAEDLKDVENVEILPGSDDSGAVLICTHFQNLPIAESLSTFATKHMLFHHFGHGALDCW